MKSKLIKLILLRRHYVDDKGTYHLYYLFEENLGEEFDLVGYPFGSVFELALHQIGSRTNVSTNKQKSIFLCENKETGPEAYVQQKKGVPVISNE